MSDAETAVLRRIAVDFRTAIERSIAEKATPHLPYFPGQPPVIVATSSPFHAALGPGADDDALEILAALPPDVAARNRRFLAQIEARLPHSVG